MLKATVMLTIRLHIERFTRQSNYCLRLLAHRDVHTNSQHFATISVLGASSELSFVSPLEPGPAARLCLRSQDHPQLQWLELSPLH